MKNNYLLKGNTFKPTMVFVLLCLMCFSLSAQSEDEKQSLTQVKGPKNTQKNKVLQEKKPQRINSKSYLKTILDNRETSKYVVTSEHTSSISGIHHTYIRQAIMV